ncbi:SDR family NAD(P)-dependent oxidoreductase [Pseudonocardia xinjiangensis]|uniref:SDR family NAD(P)-dependent oxidoreductase n=1 Tax=Pseudonocardia xinjiangensis TaxID=75289 RepID=A0ABX1R8W4_9PSEU|nr:SDR family NAD(P)-dependent oxidoreductase [Pseudonocardia xinjiangensis]NMH76813.1 SDR family NAD(P)-dependent oxidoreductase [Pseudonocardia xinjiangensis]
MTTRWLITGAGRGLGRAFAAAALGRGDAVAATVRDTSALDDMREAHGDRLSVHALNVTDREHAGAVVARAAAWLGGIDVLVNNAGYGQFGAVEELTEADVRAQLDTNFFGALWTSQAAVPIMREQGGGRIIQISSLGGIGAFANLGAYHASKWALEAISESLALEVAPFGIAVTIVEPGGFGTDWAGASSRHSSQLPEYEPVRAAAAARRGGRVSGSPERAAAALLEVVDSPRPPLRVIFGAEALDIARGIYERRLAEWSQWEAVSKLAQE